MLELKQSFVKAIGQQAPAIQQFEEIVCLFSKHNTHKTAGTQNYLLNMSTSCFNMGL